MTALPAPFAEILRRTNGAPPIRMAVENAAERLVVKTLQDAAQEDLFRRSFG